jgi:hypothetical protein
VNIDEQQLHLIGEELAFNHSEIIAEAKAKMLAEPGTG